MKLAADGPVKVLSTPRKVQLLFGGVFIVRTTNAVYVWEHPYYPQVSPLHHHSNSDRCHQLIVHSSMSPKRTS